MKIKNWHDFQHFKPGTRSMVWVKLYRKLLDDPDWHDLEPAHAKGLVNLWLLASESDGYLPDIRKISFRLRLTEGKAKELILALNHWLTDVDNNVISDGYQNDALEEDKEEDKEEETTLSGKPDLKASSKEILNFLNSKTGRNYQPVKANLEMIAARLKDGATVDELRMVVAKKCREWAADEKMNQYLRPATLFNRTKFAQYQGELLKD